MSRSSSVAQNKRGALAAWVVGDADANTLRRPSRIPFTEIHAPRGLTFTYLRYRDFRTGRWTGARCCNSSTDAALLKHA